MREAPQERGQSGYLGCWLLLPAGSPTTRLQGRLPSPRGTQPGRTTRGEQALAGIRAASEPGSGLAARGASPQTRSPPPRGDDVTTPAPPPRPPRPTRRSFYTRVEEQDQFEDLK